MTVAGGHRGKDTRGFAVGEGLGVGGAAHGPLLPGELVIGVVDLPGLDEGSAVDVLYAAGIQPAQGVIAVGVDIAGLAVGYPVELTVAGVGIGQSPAIGIGGGLSPAQSVVGEADRIVIAVGLLREQAVMRSVFVGHQAAGAS